jgi:DNA-binding transcriptional LysR family regulator
MDLRQIRSFVAVAEEQHLTRAARRLHLAQPPLSRQMRQLQDELGVALLERSGRGIRLTDAGRVFLVEAREALRAVERAADRARDAGRGIVGRLAIAFVDSIAYGGLPPAIANRFRARHAGIALELQPMISIQQWEALRAGRISAGFMHHLPEDSGTASLRLGDEPVMLVLPERHPLARKTRLRLEDLSRDPFIWFPRWRSPRYHDAVTAACAQAGFAMRVVQEVDETTTILGLVAAGMGATFAVRACGNVAPPGVVFRRVGGLAVSFGVHLAWRADDSSPALAAFVAAAREQLARRPITRGS